MSKRPQKTTTIRRGSVSTKVYRFTRKDGREVFAAAWHIDGKRMLRQFPTYEAAYAEASFRADRLSAGKVSSADMTADDGVTLSEARNICGKTPIIAALQEWREGRRLCLGSILPACEAWADRNRAGVEKILVRDLVKKFLAAKTSAGIKTADNHGGIFNDLNRDLGDQDVGAISATALDKWLGTREHPSTRNTYRKHIVVLWRWAQSKGYLPREIKTEAEHTERAIEAELSPEIINPETFEKLLVFFRSKFPDYLPALALAGFTGMRRSEIHAQTWSDINLEEGHLRVTKSKRGTPSRRLVTICPAAIEWLLLAPDRKDFVCSNLALDRIRMIAREAKQDDGSPKFEDLPENCFRHAFISHRVAATGDVPRTSFEAGNSPNIVRKHYLELVTKKEGERWFAIKPSPEAKVVTIYTKEAANA